MTFPTRLLDIQFFLVVLVEISVCQNPEQVYNIKYQYNIVHVEGTWLICHLVVVAVQVPFSKGL